MEVWYIELDPQPRAPRITLWEYCDSTDNPFGMVYDEWKHFNTWYLYTYYYKPLLF